jgi:hypothetical protein
LFGFGLRFGRFFGLPWGLVRFDLPLELNCFGCFGCDAESA